MTSNIHKLVMMFWLFLIYTLMARNKINLKYCIAIKIEGHLIGKLIKMNFGGMLVIPTTAVKNTVYFLY